MKQKKLPEVTTISVKTATRKKIAKLAIDAGLTTRDLVEIMLSTYLKNNKK